MSRQKTKASPGDATVKDMKLGWGRTKPKALPSGRGVRQLDLALARFAEWLDESGNPDIADAAPTQYLKAAYAAFCFFSRSFVFSRMAISSKLSVPRAIDA